MTRLTKDLIAWSVAASLAAALFLDELLGILGVAGLKPITVDAVHNHFLAGIITLALVLSLPLWLIHLYINRNRK